MTSPWTEPRVVATLKDLLAGNLSASMIAAALSGKFSWYFSRNAVIGKCHRMGLALPVPSTRANGPRRKRRPVSDGRKHNGTVPRIRGRNAEKRRKKPGRLSLDAIPSGFHASLTADRLPPTLPTQQIEVIPMTQRKTLLELTGDTCRWPLGEVGKPDFCFCGAAPDRSERDDEPYCQRHAAMAYAGARGPVYVGKAGG